MIQAKHTKKALLLCGLSLVICSAMLISTTFAWFTDSVVNTGNLIQSGTLRIDATAYATGEGGASYIIPGANNDQPITFGTVGQNLKQTTDPIINETFWEPGQSNAKLLQVTNNGTLAAKIKLEFSVTDGGLMDALWFDFVKVEEDGTVTGAFTEKPMGELAAAGESLGEVSLKGGDTLRFVLLYGMDENAGNIYQDKEFSADVTIVATQDTVESDGFHNADYDENATYPLTSGQDLHTMGVTAGSYTLGSDIGLNITGFADAPNVQRKVDLDLNGKTITLDSVSNPSIFAAMTVNLGGTLTVNGNGTIQANVLDTYCFHVNGIFSGRGGTLIINGGTYVGNPCAVYVQVGSAIINGGFFDCEPDSDTGDTRFTLNRYDANKSNGKASITVTGGTFVNFNPADNLADGEGTNYVADGYTVVSETQDNGDIWYTVVPE